MKKEIRGVHTSMKINCLVDAEFLYSVSVPLDC